MIWTKEIPKRDGWYWCRYPKNGRTWEGPITVCPCEITWIDDKFVCRPAIGLGSNSNNHDLFGPIEFGKRIPKPKV